MGGGSLKNEQRDKKNQQAEKQSLLTDSERNSNRDTL